LGIPALCGIEWVTIPEPFAKLRRALPFFSVRPDFSAVLRTKGLVEVSYSKAYKKEAEILKIDLFLHLKSPNRWRFSRYEEA
jgi:hypothetical protein